MHAGEGDFERRMLGDLVGMLHWPQFDALWQRLREAPQGWFVCEADQAAPLQPSDPGRFLARLGELEALLKRELRTGYCGLVYVDDPDAPGFVKIFDPRTLGSMCSHGGTATPPAWVLSRCRPARYPAASQAADTGGRWWARRQRR